MGKVALTILEPQDGQRFTESVLENNVWVAKVRLRGGVPPPGHGQLYYRWYSGIEDALNAASSTAAEIDASLTVGSHVLTFSAKDVPGESLEAIQTVKEAGMAGGPPRGGGPPDAKDPPCVVHVYIATIVAPAEKASLSKGDSTLIAVAPKQWGRPVDFDDLDKGYEPNPDYHGDDAQQKVRINKIRYRWRFRPSGAPEGRPARDLVPSVGQLTFLEYPAESGQMVVRYRGALPAELGTGAYTLALRVEELDEGQGGPTFGVETAPREVTLA